MSYITLPFLNKSEQALNAHSNRWESKEMAQIFRELGYEVDLIDITNTTFVPKKKYDFFVDNFYNMERIAPLLGPECIKIFHATTAYWKFNNEAEEKRLNNLFVRRGVRLTPVRSLPSNHAIELCDLATMLGNEFTLSTYPQDQIHKITRLSLSTTYVYPKPEVKDFENIRKNFIWFGGAGLVHKGLDLVLEAFAQMPEYNLTICGKIGEGEKDFLEVYKNELTLPNIKLKSFIDPGSREFAQLRNETVALIYPSCSEGQSGSVVVCMHAGLIPILSRESGVDVGNFGRILKENTIEEIKNTCTEISLLSVKKLEEYALGAWQYARDNHTRERFSKIFRSFVEKIEK